MATMNFSIPDEVKEAFNAEFASENKSAIIADLMRKAVEARRRSDAYVTEEVRRSRFDAALRRLDVARRESGGHGDEAIGAARAVGRP